MDKSVLEFARQVHDAYTRSGPFPSLPWDELNDADRNFLLTVYGQILETVGKNIFGNDSAGPTTLVLTSSDTHVRFDFGAKLTGMTLEKPDAVNFALSILQKCGVNVNIQIAADPGGPPA